MTFTFALPHGFDWDINQFTKQVKTKKWASTYKRHLGNWADRLTSANRDDRQIIGGLLQTAYGVNIGKQIDEKLSDNDLSKIRLNIIQTFYG